MKVPFLRLNFDPLLNKKLSEKTASVIEGGHYILGPEVQQFEAEFAQFCETRFCVGVSNGLDALVLALRALGIQAGDKVVVPAHTFIATWLAVTMVGAEIVPVEIDENTAQLDALALAKVLEQQSGIKAVILVHLYGNLGSIEKIQSLCQQFKVVLIEDSAQAHGSVTRAGKTGALGEIATFSFYPGKNLGAIGDAGAITTSDPKLYESCVMLRNYGSAKKYHHALQGGNQRLDEMQAAILLEKMKKLESWNEIRRNQVAAYELTFSSISKIKLLQHNPGDVISWHLFVIRINEREVLQNFLKTHGIETIIHYPIPCHLSEAYRNLGYKKGDFPITERFSDTCLSLPIGPHLSMEQIQWVGEKVCEFFR